MNNLIEIKHKGGSALINKNMIVTVSYLHTSPTELGIMHNLYAGSERGAYGVKFTFENALKAIEAYEKLKKNSDIKSSLKDILNKNFLEAAHEITPPSAYVINCLKDIQNFKDQYPKIETIRDLIVLSEEELMKIPNLGRKRLNEIKKILEELSKKYNVNLHLGMKGI